jgi:acetyl esterase/lipase
MRTKTDAFVRPPEITAFLREIGPRWSQSVAANVKAVVAEYDPLLAASEKCGVRTDLDIAYGEHERQVLDVFHRPGVPPHATVIFLHGGAFTDGERNRSPQVYSNVLTYLARHGVLGINMEYRSAPADPYPAGTEDAGAVFRWVCENAARYGADPDNIFLMGHSAGAAHAATLVYDGRFSAALPRPPRGLIVVSGRVRIDNLPENPNARKVEAYYGTDPERLDALSPVAFVDADSAPTFIAYAEYENPLIDVYCLELAHRLAVAKRRAPPVLRMAEHNHTSIIAHINTDEDLLGREIRRFIDDNCV